MENFLLSLIRFKCGLYFPDIFNKISMHLKIKLQLLSDYKSIRSPELKINEDLNKYLKHTKYINMKFFLGSIISTLAARYTLRNVAVFNFSNGKEEIPHYVFCLVCLF